MTGDRSERHYRRLLYAYPGRYRRRYGSEMLTTLLEMSEAGQSRAGGWHILASGIRYRFRLPARNPVAVAGALLAALFLAALGATAGSWLGWRGASEPPTDEAISRLLTTLAGSVPEGPVEHDEVAGFSRRVSAVNARPTAHRTADQAADLLTAEGWHVHSVYPGGLFDFDGVPIAPTNGAAPIPGTDGAELQLMATPQIIRIGRVAATKDGIALQAYLWPPVDQQGGVRLLSAWPREPAPVRALVVAGMVAGGVLGWLLAAALAYRLRSQRWAAVLSVAGMVVLVVPVAVIYVAAARMFRTGSDVEVPYMVHAAFRPGETSLVIWPALAGLVLAVVVFVLAHRAAPAEVLPVGRPG